MILRSFFEDFGDLVPFQVPPTEMDTFFCTSKMHRSRSSEGVGWCPAACYVGGHVLQVGCATSGDIWGAPENVIPKDTFFCTLFPVFVSSLSLEFSGEALKSATYLSRPPGTPLKYFCSHLSRPPTYVGHFGLKKFKNVRKSKVLMGREAPQKILKFTT